MPLVTLVAGVSASGKSRLVHDLAEKHKGRIAVPVAFTTRAPREGESHGVDYYFVNSKQYACYVSEGILLTDITYNNKRYGYTKGEFARALCNDRRILCVTDRKNVEVIKAVYPETAAIWLDISTEEQQRRLGRRETPEVIRQRLAISDEERSWARQNAHLFRFASPDTSQAELATLLESIVFDD